jgi:translation initiation factor 2B subunit (eIF-2B alpha/beta/delta family)
MMAVSQLVQRLQADKTSGATPLLDLAIAILEAFASQPLPTRHHDFYQALGALTRDIMAAQPSMAVMITLAQAALQACAAASSPTVARQQLRHTLTAFRRQAHAGLHALCQHTVALLPHQATIVTYSNSHSVTTALQQAHACGRVRRVILSESRPAYDGRLQAQALAEAQIEVEYSVDMGLFERLPEADAVLLGADAVFPHGVVNKLGTHALVQLARAQNLPVWSLCLSLKFLPAAASALFRIIEHPGHEVWPEAPQRLRMHNHYFDTTPLSLFTGIISEAGVHTSDVLRHSLLALQLDPALLARS